MEVGVVLAGRKGLISQNPQSFFIYDESQFASNSVNSPVRQEAKTGSLTSWWMDVPPEKTTHLIAVTHGFIPSRKQACLDCCISANCDT